MSETPSQPVAADELLARFITVERWVRPDRTVKPDAFIPPNDLQLSVTRHILLSEEGLWHIGEKVADEVAAKKPGARLYGRADLRVRDVCGQKLRTEAAPLPDNPNHAHITGWPGDKPARKTVAQELAASAVLHFR